MRYKFEVINLRSKLFKKNLSSQDVENFQRIRKSLDMVYPYTFTLEKDNRPNYETKSLIFTHYINELNAVRFYQRYLYLRDSNQWIDYTRTLSYEQYLKKRDIVQFAEKIYDEQRILYNECLKIVNADKERRRRLQKRVESIVNTNKGYFVTFTFNDEYLSSTNYKTRRVNVHRFLNSISNNYVANVDYGKLNDREHYHAVVRIDTLTNCFFEYSRKYHGYISYSADEFKPCTRWGYYTIRQIKIDIKDIVKVSKYVSKLTNHAIKNTTKRNALIYSR